MQKQLPVLLIVLNIYTFSFSQHATDSLIRTLINDRVVSSYDAGREMMLKGNLSDAGSYYNSAIAKDESNVNAFYNRGIVHLALNDTASACRDWSAVLALGDTATYLLLESKCHSTMYLDDDVIPASRYKKMYSAKETEAMKIADVMPQFPGGNRALLEFIKMNWDASQCANSGTVYVRITVSSKGKVMYPHISRGVNKICNEEALRIIKKMPDWIPGKFKGKNVPVTHVVPVRF